MRVNHFVGVGASHTYILVHTSLIVNIRNVSMTTKGPNALHVHDQTGKRRYGVKQRSSGQANEEIRRIETLNKNTKIDTEKYYRSQPTSSLSNVIRTYIRHIYIYSYI